MTFKFLGTGTSVGVPQIGCDCKVCTSKDPRDRRRRCGAYVRGTSAAVEFADQGIGMTARQMRRAFGRFYRAAGLHECGKGGFGIGLYTSRVAARRMGGDLTVRANTPKGCVFTFVLKRLEKGLEIRE